MALVRRAIAGRVFFMYSDDMNSSNTAETICMKYASQTSDSFHPHDSIWINCNNFTYFPHSNECSPRTIPALTVLACHPSPSPNILLPFMDDNIAQLSRWWIAASLVGNCVDIATLQDKFPQICENSDLSWNHPSNLSNMASLTTCVVPQDKAVDSTDSFELSAFPTCSIEGTQEPISLYDIPRRETPSSQADPAQNFSEMTSTMPYLCQPHTQDKAQ